MSGRGSSIKNWDVAGQTKKLLAESATPGDIFFLRVNTGATKGGKVQGTAPINRERVTNNQ